MDFLQPRVQHSAANPDIEILSHASASAARPRPPARSSTADSVSATFTSNPPVGYRAPPPTAHGVVPRPGHPDDDKLRDTKQHMIDRFRHYHLGRVALSTYDPEKRRAIFRHIPIPPQQGSWPGHPPPANRTIWPMTDPDPDRNRRGRLGRLLPWGRGGAGGGGPRRADEQAADRWAGILRRDFRVARFRFRRRLGYGAFGAAFLFEMKGEDGEVLPVVAKVGISGNWRELAREKENFVSMAGAQHFVQREVLQTFSLPAEPMASHMLGSLRRLFSRVTGIGRQSLASMASEATARRLEAARRRLDNRRDIIMMEYMSRGTLHSLIAKLHEKEDRLSDRMLWLIFECLFKACIAMAYPGRFYTRGEDPWNGFMTPQDETPPDEFRLPDAPMVHFDIDPSNALIGDFGPPDDDHGCVPIVKIGDPGLSRIIDEDFRRDEYQLWSQRPTGKADYLTPEQFTPEWDYEASRGLEDLSREETAGNYHWWSNLYQIGWVMSCLVTHHAPPFPPVAWSYKYPAEDGRMVNLDGYSYGKLIFHENFDGYDFRLRYLIARCLEHNPTKRPTLLYVAEFIAANLRREDLRERESDEELLRNARRIFAEAP